MQKIKYTQNFKKIIHYAAGFSPSTARVISGDSLFFGCYHILRTSENSEILRKLLGFNDLQVIEDMYKKKIAHITEEGMHSVFLQDDDIYNDVSVSDDEYVGDIDGGYSWGLAIGIERLIIGMSSKGNNKIDIMTLFLCSLQNLSRYLVKVINTTAGGLDIVVSNCTMMVKQLKIDEVGIFVFLEKIASILEKLHLDISQLPDMRIADDNTINSMLESLSNQTGEDIDVNQFDILAMADSSDVDIMDRDDMIQDDSKSKKKKQPREEKKLTVEFFGTDLTQEASDGQLDPCIGRQKEIDQTIYTLLRKTKNNPLLIGEAGVGKTAIVEGLAQKIANGDVPEKIKNKKIYMIDMGTLVAGTKYRGDFETRFKAILEEAADPTNNIILFIDEIHTLMGAGGQSGTDDASQLIKPMLARGKIKLIGATTFDEYQKHLEKDAALKRRFQEIHVNEPSAVSTKEILLGLKERYEDFHGVKIQEASIDAAIGFSQRYILNKFLPDKAIDLIDEACARKSTIVHKLDNDKEYQKVMKKLKSLDKDMEKYVEKQDYYAAAELKKEQDVLKNTLHDLRSNKNIPLHMRPEVNAGDVGQVLADKTGIPADIVTSSEVEALKRLHATLTESILGQEEAVNAVVRSLQRNRLSVIERKKPIASFMFLGPSGVGKTYLAKLIAKDYFGDEKSLIRVDMSEYMEKYSVSKLIGSAPGYVGHESGGILTEAVRRQPYAVILFDEIEKADRDVLNILLQLLDEGQLKDAKGRFVSFASCIIIMTSNLGHEEFVKKVTRIGFSQSSEIESNAADFASKKAKVMEHVKDFMSPELINRIDNLLVFQPLSKEMLQKIMKQKIDAFLSIWKEKSTLTLPKFSAKQIVEIIDKIYDPAYGARPLEKYIHDTIETEIIDSMMV